MPYSDPEKYAAYQLEWSEKNRGKRRAYAQKFYGRNPGYQLKQDLKKYGLSLKQYEQMLSDQNGVCAICSGKTSRRLAVDHDHQTGRVRGLLCGRCNAGLGQFKENPLMLHKAIRYLLAQAN